MPRVRLCALTELPELQSRVFDAGGLRLAVARSGSAVFAVEDRCSHDDGELGEGRVLAGADGAEIECPRHGARFDLASGRATRMPAVAPIECFRAGVTDGDVWVDLPEE